MRSLVRKICSIILQLVCQGDQNQRPPQKVHLKSKADQEAEISEEKCYEKGTVHPGCLTSHLLAPTLVNFIFNNDVHLYKSLIVTTVKNGLNLLSE